MKQRSWDMFIATSLFGIIAYGLSEPYFPVDTNKDMVALLVQYIFGLIGFWVVSMYNKPRRKQRNERTI